MSSEVQTPEQSAGAPSPSPAAIKSHRVLACVLCQQRKVKCDRRFPCANCIKAGVQCVSAALAPRQRRRRFPERDLLDRLRQYEDLLRRNRIPFEPLHGSPDKAASYSNLDTCVSPEQTGDRAKVTHDTGSNISGFRAKNYWHAMNRKPPHPDSNDSNESDEGDDDSDNSPYVMRQVEVKNAWDQLYFSNDHLLFCGRNANVELSALHPSQVQVFKLWQVYLDNVNPLLKVTHTPTLQARIIDAAGDVANISPPLEALMFAIYCIAVFSLSDDDCRISFGTPRQDVLRAYQLGAREALLRCDFLRSADRDCLTAFHLYLITVKPDTDPRSLSSMLGTAVRIAQRMGINTEAANNKHSFLEAEMRRRLWWSLVLFDARISEMTDLKTCMLVPTWDCKLPLNVNDFDLRTEMKNPPVVYMQTSEPLFAVVRSEIGDFVRHSSSHLDFINPILRSIPRRGAIGTIADATELAALETMIESKYLEACDPDNALHYMTIWVARVAIAKAKFTHHLSVSSQTPQPPLDAKNDTGIAHARAMLESDTKLMSSPLIKGFRWMVYLHFPFPAYVHLVDDLKRRPLGEYAAKAWTAMSDNCTARFMDHVNLADPADKRENPFFKIFAGMVLQAWSAREKALGHSKEPPLIVSQIQQRLTRMRPSIHPNDFQTQPGMHDNGGIEPTSQASVDHSDFNSLYMSNQLFGDTSSDMFSTTPVLSPLAGGNSLWGWPTGDAYGSSIRQGW